MNLNLTKQFLNCNFVTNVFKLTAEIQYGRRFHGNTHHCVIKFCIILDNYE